MSGIKKKKKDKPKYFLGKNKYDKLLSRKDTNH